MKKLALIIALLLVFAFAMALFSTNLSHADQSLPSPTVTVDEAEEGMTEEIGPEEPILPFA